MIDHEILNTWENGAPKQVRFSSGEIDNHCMDCGRVINRFIPSDSPGVPGSYRKAPDHDAHCDVRDYDAKTFGALMSVRI